MPTSERWNLSSFLIEIKFSNVAGETPQIEQSEWNRYKRLKAKTPVLMRTYSIWGGH